MDLSTLHLSQFKWQDIHQKAFDSMIDAIQNNTSSNLPDPPKPFFVQTDASDVVRAGRVFQKDDQGKKITYGLCFQSLYQSRTQIWNIQKGSLILIILSKVNGFFP
jgi:hypothetical protein